MDRHQILLPPGRLGGWQDDHSDAGRWSPDDSAWALDHPHGYGITENPSPWGYNRGEYLETHAPGSFGYYDPMTGGYSSPTEIPFAGGGTPDWATYGSQPGPSDWAGLPTGDQGYVPHSMDTSMPGAGGAPWDAGPGVPQTMDASMPGAMPGGDAGAQPSYDLGQQGQQDTGAATQTFADALSAYMDQVGSGDQGSSGSAGSWG